MGIRLEEERKSLILKKAALVKENEKKKLRLEELERRLEEFVQVRPFLLAFYFCVRKGEWLMMNGFWTGRAQRKFRGRCMMRNESWEWRRIDCFKSTGREG